MPSYNSVMIDLETTGTSPDDNAIIEIAAVQFNLETREVNPDFFVRCMIPAHRRYWDESTRDWWCKQPESLRSIYERMEDPEKVMNELYEWLGGPYCQLALWAKPLSFESPFIASYFRQFGRPNPLAYWKGRDLRSFIQGRAPGFDEKTVQFQGTPHVALDDTLHQLRILYAALDWKPECEQSIPTDEALPS